MKREEAKPAEKIGERGWRPLACPIDREYCLDPHNGRKRCRRLLWVRELPEGAQIGCWPG